MAAVRSGTSVRNRSAFPVPPAEQQHQEGRAVPGQCKNGFVEQMLKQVLAADVDDKGDFRPRGGNVGEVLFRTDADIDAAGSAQLDYRRNNVQVGGLIRNEVVAREVAGLGSENAVMIRANSDSARESGTAPCDAKRRSSRTQRSRQNQKSKKFQCRGVTFSFDKNSTISSSTVRHAVEAVLQGGVGQENTGKLPWSLHSVIQLMQAVKGPAVTFADPTHPAAVASASYSLRLDKGSMTQKHELATHSHRQSNREPTS